MFTEVPDLELLVFQSSERAMSHPIIPADRFGFKRAVVKAQRRVLREICGYRLASLCNVRTPRFAPFFNPTNSAVLAERDIGQLGLLIEHLPDWRPIQREEAAVLDPEATGAAFAIFAFDQHEWGEFGVAQSAVHLIDLEFVLPYIDQEDAIKQSRSEFSDSLACARESYRSQARSHALYTLDEARKVGVLDRFVGTIRSIHELPVSAIQESFDISPCPNAFEFREFMAAELHERTRVVLSVL